MKLADFVSWAEHHKDLVPWITVLLGVIGGAWALRLYWRNSHRDRARWLVELYDRFFGTKEYQSVRSALEGTSPAFLDRLRAVIDGRANDSEADEELTHYLNFFELVTTLERRGELRSRDVEDLFGWQLDAISQQAQIDGYLRRYGYESLRQAAAQRRRPVSN